MKNTAYVRKAVKDLLKDPRVGLEPCIGAIIVTISQVKDAEGKEQTAVNVLGKLPPHTVYIMLEAATNMLKARVPSAMIGITEQEQCDHVYDAIEDPTTHPQFAKAKCTKCGFEPEPQFGIKLDS